MFHLSKPIYVFILLLYYIRITVCLHIESASASGNKSTSMGTCRPSCRCKVAFYSNDSQLSNRKASLGYGTKHDFTKDLTASPGATKYNIRSIFDENKTRGKSFGLSRELSPDRSYLVPQLNKVPGPGQVKYMLLSTRIKSKPGCPKASPSGQRLEISSKIR